MKALSPAAAGAFFLNHGEKLVMGLVGIVAILMVWWGVSAAQSEGVNSSRKPDAIDSLARQAAANIEAVTAVPRDRVPPLLAFAPRVDPWRSGQVKLAEPPARSLVLNSPPASERTKRKKPAVFPIEDLRAVAGMAVFADQDATKRQPGVVPPHAAPAPPPGRPTGRRATRPNDQPPDTGFGFGGLTDPAAPLMAAAPPLEPGKIAPFVVVTGLVPSGKQQAEFERKFAMVSYKDPKRDHPKWTQYIVERTRVVPGASPRWERLQLVNVVRHTAGAAPAAPSNAVALHEEALPKGFFLQPDETEIDYAAALPQRIDGPWGEESLHPWFLPEVRDLLEKGLAGAVEVEPPVDGTLAELAKNPSDFVGKRVRLTGVALDPEHRVQRNVRLHRFSIRSADGKVVVEQGPIGESEKLVFATSEEYGSKLAFDLEGGKPRPCNVIVRIDQAGKTPVARLLEIALLDEAGEVTEKHADSAPEPVVVEVAGGGPAVPAQDPTQAGPRSENRLFRFVDLSVVPGAEYRYRVKFALRNPNVNLAPQHLDNVADAKGDFLVADYSPETPTVRVPDPTRILVRTMPRDAAKALKVRDSNVEVIVMAKSEENGNYALRLVVTSAGGAANVDPALNKVSEKRHFGEPVQTDRVLIDVRGAQEERAPTRNPQPSEPVEMLFLKPDGEFDIVSAADSALFLEKYRSTLFPPGEDLPAGAKPIRPPKAPKQAAPGAP